MHQYRSSMFSTNSKLPTHLPSKHILLVSSQSLLMVKYCILMSQELPKIPFFVVSLHQYKVILLTKMPFELVKSGNFCKFSVTFNRSPRRTFSILAKGQVIKMLALIFLLVQLLETPKHSLKSICRKMENSGPKSIGSYTTSLWSMTHSIQNLSFSKYVHLWKDVRNEHCLKHWFQ